LQQKSIENHTPLYWAIIMRRPSTQAPDHDGDDLITMLLTRSTPLISSTISDMRHACLLASDHALFERFKRCPYFRPLSGTDQMILGSSISPDTIDVEYVGDESDKEDFVANFKILEFQKRVRVSDGVELEFIAKGRIWGLEFSLTSSKWVIRLSILGDSPDTWVDSCLIIDEASPQRSITPTRTKPSLIDAAILNTLSTGQPLQNRGKPAGKPAIKIPLQTMSDQLTTWTPIEVPLEDSSLGSSLKYDGCPYLDAEGTLQGRLKVRLAKSKVRRTTC